MKRWTPEQARDWYDKLPFMCGFNYVPSSAVNSTEMWQSDTFDPITIERELGWAAAIGFNTCRIFLQELVFTTDPDGFLKRLDTFLRLADAQGIATMPVLFDDCAFAGKEPYPGEQFAPVLGIHNSQWTPCPSSARATDAADWDTLQEYVTAIVTRFRDDKRVLVWDAYNEPGNSGLNDLTMPLVEAACGWVRAAAPSQPLTVGVWNDSSTDMNERLIALSDVVSFHNYDTLFGASANIRAAA